MADLRGQTLGGVEASPVTAPQPVVDRSTVEVTKSAAKLVNLGASIFDANRKKEANSNLSAFASKQLEIAEAVDRGDLDSATGRARMRMNFSETLSEGSVAYKDLTLAQSGIMSTAGLGKVVATGTQEEQEQILLDKSARAAGWDNTDDFVQFNKAQSDIKAQQAKVNYETSKIGLENKKTTREQRTALGSMNDAYTRKFRSDIDKIVEDVDLGAMSAEDATFLLDQQWGTIQSLINSQGSEAGSEFVSSITAPMRSIYDLSRKRVTGEISAELFQNANNINVAKAKLTITNNPKHAQTLALSSMLPNADLLLSKEIGDIVLDQLSKNANPESGKVADTTDPDASEETNDYFQIIKQNVKKLNDGSALDMEKTEVDVMNNLSSVIRGISDYAGSVEKPEDYNNVVAFLASPEVGKLVQKQGGIPSDALEDAKAVFQSEYKDEVIQSLIREFETGTITGPSFQALQGGAGEEVGFSDNILPVFSGAGITFVSKVPTGRQAGTGNAIRDRVKTLNKTVAPVLNRLIRLDAHLNGNTDYAKVYRENYEELLMAPEPEVEATPVTPAEKLEMEDPSMPLPRSMNKEQVAQIEGLRDKGFTKDQIIGMMDTLGLSKDNVVGGELTNSINEVFGNA